MLKDTQVWNGGKKSKGKKDRLNVRLELSEWSVFQLALDQLGELASVLDDVKTDKIMLDRNYKSVMSC